VAGCLLISSTQASYFASPARQALIADYARLIALAFTQEQFYPLEWINLRVMPPLVEQRRLLITLPRRIPRIIQEASSNSRLIARSEAEQLAWQQVEEELIQPPR
jgi:hypothetical protein